MIQIGDVLYAYFDGPLRNKYHQRTWSFRCQGVLMTHDKCYILGPGDVLYELGVDCFRTAIEAREKGSRSGRPSDLFRLVKLTEVEKVRI